jgi:hypothetical protein
MTIAETIRHTASEYSAVIHFINPAAGTRSTIRAACARNGALGNATIDYINLMQRHGWSLDVNCALNHHTQGNSIETPETTAEKLSVLELMKQGKVVLIPKIHDPSQIDPLTHAGVAREKDTMYILTQSLFSQANFEKISAQLPDQIKKAYISIIEQMKNPETDGILTSKLFESKEFVSAYLQVITYLSTGKLCDPNRHINQFMGVYRAVNNKLSGIPIPMEHLVSTIPAAFIGFAVNDKGGDENGLNRLSDTTLLLTRIIRGDHAGTFSPLCAQYVDSGETAEESTNELEENIVRRGVERAMRWQNMLLAVSVLNCLDRPRQIIWATLVGNKDSIQSIIPTTVKQYGENNALAKMMLLLTRHMRQMQKVSDENGLTVSMYTLHEIMTATKKRLVDLFGENWESISFQALTEKLNEIVDCGSLQLQTGMEQLAINECVNGGVHRSMIRFYGESKPNNDLFENSIQSLEDDLQNLTPQEWVEFCRYHNWNPQTDRNCALVFLRDVLKEIKKQGEITTSARAIHEAILYQEIGRFLARHNLLLVGLDIDHTKWQTTCIRNGYNIEQALIDGQMEFQNGGLQQIAGQSYPGSYARKQELHIGRTDRANGITRTQKYREQKDTVLIGKVPTLPYNTIDGLMLREEFTDY